MSMVRLRIINLKQFPLPGARVWRDIAPENGPENTTYPFKGVQFLRAHCKALTLGLRCGSVSAEFIANPIDAINSCSVDYREGMRQVLRNPEKINTPHPKTQPCSRAFPPIVAYLSFASP